LDDLFQWQSIGLIIAGYVADGKMMGREEWAFYYGVEIGPETEEIKAALEFRPFYKFYHGPNPVDVMENKMKNEGEPKRLVRQICETSLIPTIVPKKVIPICETSLIPTIVPKKVIPTIHVIGINLINLELERDFNLKVLGELAEHPQNGHAAKYAYESDAVKQHGTNGTDRTHLVFLLKDVVARNKKWVEQVQYLKALKVHTGYECEAEPEALSQNTAVMAHHAVTGERPFGDESGLEGRRTYGRTVELMNNAKHVISGGFSAGAIGPLGGSDSAELHVSDCRFDIEYYGVGVLRKFKAGVWI